MSGPIGESAKLVIENLPAVAAIAGMAAGSTIEWVNQRHDQNERLALSESLVDAGPEPSRIRRFSRAAAFGMFTGLVAVTNAVAWESTLDTEVVPASVQVVVDASGATMFNDGQAHRRAARLTEEIGNTDGIDGSAFVARGGAVEPARTDEIIDYPPLGNAPMGEATASSLGAIRSDRQADEQRTGAVVIITNGTGLNNSQNMVRRAREGEIPISIVNTLPTADTDETAIEQFEVITERTGGQYFTRQQGTAEAVIEGLQDSLRESAAKAEDGEANKPDRLLQAIGAGLGASWLGSLMQRRSKPLFWNKKR